MSFGFYDFINNSVCHYVLQIVIFLLVAPFLSGVIRKVKAISQKRKGFPMYQVYLDIFKLLSKDLVISDKASWIFSATPYIVLSATIAAAALVPVSLNLKLNDYAGDIIVFVSILALARFFMVLAGLDTASTFGGMGSSREIMVSALFEPSLMLTLFSLGLMAKTTSIKLIMVHSSEIGYGIFSAVYILLFVSVFIILIAETARIPVDDPATHLELTMIHEAMLLEYSGRHLAFMELAATLKQLIFITLIANIFIPTVGLEIWLTAGHGKYLFFAQIFVYFVKVVMIAVLVGLTEVFTVKLRLMRVSEFAVYSFAFAFFAFIMVFVLGA